MKYSILFIFLLSFSAFAQMTQAEFDGSIAALMGNDQQKATASVEGLEKKYPNSAEALYLRGIYQFRDGNNNAALMSFSNSIKADPEFAMAYDGRASLLYDKGMYDKAIADETQAVRLAPTNPGFVKNRAKFYNTNRQYKEALEDMKTAIRLQPDLAMNYHDAAIFAKLADANADGDIYFKQAYANTKIDKFLTDLLYGKFLLKQGRFDEGKSKLEAALAADGHDFYGEDYHDLAIAYYKVKDYAKAEANFKRAIAMVPEDVDYRCNLCSVYMDLQNFEMVKATAKDALAQNSEHPLANMFMAVGLNNTGNPSLAAEYEAKAKRLDAEQNK